MQIIKYDKRYRDELVKLIVNFRIDLAALRSIEKKVDIKAAFEELEYYLENQFPIYLAMDDTNKILGYIVCRLQEDIVWNESLYVIPEDRRKGVGTALFIKTEALARTLGRETVYNWVDPNNYRSLLFLKKLGYNVLNLIEIRKRISTDIISQKIQVGKFEFDY